jgi:hypothetical protein
MIALMLAAVMSNAAAARQVLSEAPPLLANAGQCREVAEEVGDQQSAEPRKLGALPPAQAEWTVMRKVAGCMVAVPMKTYRPALKTLPLPRD